MPGLPNLWSLCNLQGSPYFQTTLGAASPRYPLSLFVGRAPELHQLLRTIGGSTSSRQAVGGAPGIGKTTLVQAAKGEALIAGYWTTDEVVPLYPSDTTESVLGRILGAVYDAIITARPTAQGSPALQQAQQMVRAYRVQGGGANVSLLGVGAGMSQSQTAVTPPGVLLLDGPGVLRDLLTFVQEAGGAGVVVHVNNLENLSESDTQNAAEVLRSLRDPVLLQDGLHVILVGTSDAVTQVVQRYPQVRTVVSSPLLLGPLAPTEVQELLAARYRYLVLDPLRPPIPPVVPNAVETLYTLFHGDLRGLLKALEDGATALLGVAQSEAPPALDLVALRPALQARYAIELAATAGDKRADLLQRWAEAGVESQRTQAELMHLWKARQPTTSLHLKALIEDGYVEALPRRGGEPIEYRLTGVSQLAFG